jgi:hypothetical protein
MQQHIVKTIVIFSLLFFIASSYAQGQTGCGHRPVLVVGSVGAKFNITVEAKIGIWQNTRSSGVTMFAGIMTDVVDITTGKSDQSRSTNDQGFIEIGYKFRIDKKLFSHSMTGTTGNKIYLGTELLYQADNTLLIGVGFKRNIAGIIAYMHF